jgi:hypothetical protein
VEAQGLACKGSSATAIGETPGAGFHVSSVRLSHQGSETFKLGGQSFKMLDGDFSVAVRVGKQLLQGRRGIYR